MSITSLERNDKGEGQSGQCESDFEPTSEMDLGLQMGTKGLTSPRRHSAHLANGTYVSMTFKAMARKA